jgi:hypothetical protein
MPAGSLPSVARLLPLPDLGLLRSVTPPAPTERRNVALVVARHGNAPAHSNARRHVITDLRAVGRHGW